MRRLFRLRPSMPLLSTPSLPRGSPEEPHGEAQERPTGARCGLCPAAEALHCCRAEQASFHVYHNKAAMRCTAAMPRLMTSAPCCSLDSVGA